MHMRRRDYNPAMEQYRITAICCAPPDRSGAAHTTNLLGHLQVNVKCAQCGREFSVDYNPRDLQRIPDFETRLLAAAQKAVDSSHRAPMHGGPYLNIEQL
jgi:hypothetical protein